MKKLNFTIIILFLLSISAYSQNIKYSVETEKGKVDYEKLDGRFNGIYTSYHKNGQKKAEGKFENNYRTGVWTLWDEKGKELLKKEYFSPFVTNMADAVSVKEFDYNKNEDGFIDYYPLEQKNVAWSKRIWRTIDKKNNPVLFNGGVLFEIFNSLSLNGVITTYDQSDDEFTKKLSLEQLSSMYIDNIEVIAYKVKEETFYDSERQVMETRIIGICPVIKNSVTGESKNLFWIYFPEVRKYMGFQQLVKSNFPEHIKTMDDLFFYKCYSGQITQASNSLGNTLADLYEDENEQKEVAEKIELSMIQAEYKLWLKK